ncbi:MAG: hypothetical protein ABIJ08_01140 [Nanoarchaeota archaeon]
MNKKAALELSINAIVVIIIAVVVLSLGLGFVRMLFGGATAKFAALIEDEQEPPIPSADQPVTLSRSMVVTGVGQSNAIKISVYNPTNHIFGDVQPVITCGGTILDANPITNKKDIPQGEYATYTALFDIKKDAAQPSSALCGINIINRSGEVAEEKTLYSIDYTIRVQK